MSVANGMADLDRSLQREFAFFLAEGLTKSFGGLQAVSDFNLELNSGEIAGLIGPNGAGKTTVFHLITGLLPMDSGKVYFERRYIEDLPAHRIARLGIARTFQTSHLLEHMSVLDNIKIAYHYHSRYGLSEAALRLPGFFRVEREIADRAMHFLSLVGMQDDACLEAAALPYGKRRRLELARALATEATLLLLDEPAAGLNPQETSELAGLIRRIRDEFHVTVLLIEHDMRMVMSLCERIVVLNFGKVIASGTPAQVQASPEVIAAYLGERKARN